MTKTMISLCSLMLLPTLSGCSLNNGPGTGPPDWDRMAPVIQSRVRVVAAFAFTMQKVKPHKEGICKGAEQLSDFLNNYQDEDATFDTLRKAAMDYLDVAIEDPAVRETMIIVVDMVLTESFNYAWLHYMDLVNTDQAKAAHLIASAVANGLLEACNL